MPTVKARVIGPASSSKIRRQKKLEKKTQFKKKIGRTSQLTPQIYHAICLLSAEGKTRKEIAEILGVSFHNIAFWCFENENLKADIKLAKAAVNHAVEIALLQAAVGYTHEDEKIHFTKTGKIIRAKTKKQYAPNVEAAKFWLINRKPKDWSTKEKIATDSQVTVNLAYNPNSRLVEGNNGTTQEGQTGEGSGRNDSDANSDAEVDLQGDAEL